MDDAQYLAQMKAPNDKRQGAWRGRIIQLHVTRACDLKCSGCTQSSQLGGRPVMISLDNVELALKSFRCREPGGFDGVVGVFGGNPAKHPHFRQICELVKHYVPFVQRGLWCNHPHGHGKLMAETFNPEVSNLNVHRSQEAFDEFLRDWPGCKPFGLHEDSMHPTPLVSMRDMAMLDDETPNTEDNRWKKIAKCDVNQFWSSMICEVPGKGLRGFFCEIAGMFAMMYAHRPDEPDLGIPVTPDTGWDWWQLPMTSFADQARRYCHGCGIPLKRRGQLAVASHLEEHSSEHAEICKPKDPARELVQVDTNMGRGVSKVTTYIENSGK